MMHWLWRSLLLQHVWRQLWRLPSWRALHRLARLYAIGMAMQLLRMRLHSLWLEAHDTSARVHVRM